MPRVDEERRVEVERLGQGRLVLDPARDPTASSGFWRGAHGTAKAEHSHGPSIEVPTAKHLSWPAHTQKPKGKPGVPQPGRPPLRQKASRFVDCEEFVLYREKADEFRKAHSEEISRLAGGECSTGPSSMIDTAALQLAASRYLYDIAFAAHPPDPFLLKEARQQGDSARQNLLACFELAMREHKVRLGWERGTITYDPDAVTARAEEEARVKAKRRRAAREASTIETEGEAAE